MAFLVDTVTLDFRSGLQKFLANLQIRFEIIGYSRAAAHLAQQGRYDLAKECMMEIAKLKS